MSPSSSSPSSPTMSAEELNRNNVLVNMMNIFSFSEDEKPLVDLNFSPPPQSQNNPEQLLYI